MFMLLVRFPVNSRLSVVEIWGKLCKGPPTPVSSKSQL